MQRFTTQERFAPVGTSGQERLWRIEIIDNVTSDHLDVDVIAIVQRSPICPSDEYMRVNAAFLARAANDAALAMK